MAKNTTPKGKVVRRLGTNIFGNPKYDKLLKKKPSAPGQQKKKFAKKSEYAVQLMEKQKLRFGYGLTEKQIRIIYKKSKAMKGVTGENMMVLFERRLDNVLYRMGISASRVQSRQFISHGHIQVNGQRVNIPSFVVKEGDKIGVMKKEKSEELIKRMYKLNNNREVPGWVNFSETQLEGEVSRLPRADEIPAIADVQQVVEFYAK